MPSDQPPPDLPSDGPRPAEAPTLPPTADGATAAYPDGPDSVTLPPPDPGWTDPGSDTNSNVDLGAGVLGPYRDLRPVRAWRYGTVYVAVHPVLHRRVLLWVLAPEHTARRDEFLGVARGVAALEHRNVAGRVLEATTCGDVVFVAQEELPLGPVGDFRPRGRRQRWREGLFPNRALAQALHDAAEGLRAIHRAGMVHGHLSPACLGRHPAGPVCITGLGEGPAPADAGGGAGRDVHDLGATFVELVMGTRPEASGAAGRGALARRLRRQNPGLCRALAEVLERCLSTDARRRFADAARLAAAVEPLTRRELRPAGWGDRLGTHLYDIVLLPAAVGLGAVLYRFLAEALSRWLAFLGLPGPSADALVVLTFAVGGTFAVYAACETLLGWTPGRRIRGLRLVDSSGDRPSRWRLFLRSLVRFAFVAGFVFVLDGILGLLRGAGAGGTVAESLATFDPALALGLGVPAAVVCLYLTSLRTPNRRPLHDFLTGVSWYVQAREAADPVVEEAPAPAPAPTVTADSAPATSAPRAAPAAGRLDQYELRELLGQGGMGAVFAAWDTTLQRTVAVKVLNAAAAGGAALVARFQREARLAARLDHPNVARVYGAGAADGRPYLVMEFIPGETLQQRIERAGPLPLARAWDYVRQAALALREAGRLGIVHRDIKPSNLMVTAGDVIKVTDFGIARALGDDEPAPGGPSAAPPAPAGGSLTKTGALLGTPMYMSPEQARGQPLDGRSDIYSLGLTLYCLLSGRPPYPDTDVYDLLARQCSEEPAPLDGQVRELTPERAALLGRMTAKAPARRFPDYDALLAGLAATAPRPPVLASFLRRAGAEALDRLFLAIVLPVVWGVLLARVANAAHATTAAGAWLRLLPEVAEWLVCVVGVGRYGATPGKWLLRLRVIRPGRRRVGGWRALVRLAALYPARAWSLGVAVLAGGVVAPEPPFTGTVAAVGVGALLISSVLVLVDKRRRGLHDRLAGTLVVELPRKRPPASALSGPAG